MNVGELIKFLEYVQREYGNDSKVVIQVKWANELAIGAYLEKMSVGKDGTAFLQGIQ